LVAAAPTGKGKTVMAIQIALNLHSETLVVVDQENLKDQWIERLQQHLGIDPNAVGVFQGKIRKPSTCGFTVALVQTLYRNLEEVALWSPRFGLTILDEVHGIGAPQFSQTLFALGSTFRLGISATPDRRDAFDKVLKWHLGPTRVRMEDEHAKSTARVVENYTTTSWYANISPKAGRYINELTQDPERNWKLVEIIRWFVEHDRRALIMSDRIDQLEALRDACVAAGITSPIMGCYTRQWSRWKYSKDPNPRRRPVGHERGTDYTPVILKQVRVRNSANTLQNVMNVSDVLFATYAMFGKGTDLPALDAGLDASPRTFFEQVHGRILRKKEGKRKPVWVTIRDVNSQRAEFQFSKRILELEKSNAEVYQWDPERGKVKATAAHVLSEAAARRSRSLKSVRIETGPDGRDTLEIPSMQKSRSDAFETTTDKRAVKRTVGNRRSRAAGSSPAPNRRRSRSGENNPPPTTPSRSATQSGRRRRRLADQS
jgi:superfamily II DNA or RNA helicase